ncbi:uncharacterized mitochondrial protein-like protein [Tanacetum coccineum]
MWELVLRPPSSNVVGSKWVYCTKYNSDGSIDRLKARHVAQGFTQVLGVDFSDTFSPVFKTSTVRFVLSCCSQQIISHLNAEFSIKDLGRLYYFLGLEVISTPSGLFLSQSKYPYDILDRAKLLDCKLVGTPLATTTQLSTLGSLYSDPTLYRSLVGALQYLTITHPTSLMLSTKLSQFVIPNSRSFSSGHEDSSYLTITRPDLYTSYGLSFDHSPKPSLIGYSDADWGHCTETRPVASNATFDVVSLVAPALLAVAVLRTMAEVTTNKKVAELDAEFIKYKAEAKASMDALEKKIDDGIEKLEASIKAMKEESNAKLDAKFEELRQLILGTPPSQSTHVDHDPQITKVVAKTALYVPLIRRCYDDIGLELHNSNVESSTIMGKNLRPKY